MGAKVVDASVLAALAFGESRAPEAQKALGKHRLYAPRLMGYELAHVAVKKIGIHPEQEENILKALDLALRLEIQWVDVDLSAVAKLAVGKGLTAYDASYLYVSASLGIPLLTFDEKLLSRSVR
jgi:predicted nucleic acid-binding protein